MGNNGTIGKVSNQLHIFRNKGYWGRDLRFGFGEFSNLSL